MNDLPPELIASEIVKWLDPLSFCRFMCTCKSLYRLLRPVMKQRMKKRIDKYYSTDLVSFIKETSILDTKMIKMTDEKWSFYSDDPNDYKDPISIIQYGIVSKSCPKFSLSVRDAVNQFAIKKDDLIYCKEILLFVGGSLIEKIPVKHIAVLHHIYHTTMEIDNDYVVIPFWCMLQECGHHLEHMQYHEIAIYVEFLPEITDEMTIVHLSFHQLEFSRENTHVSFERMMTRTTQSVPLYMRYIYFSCLQENIRDVHLILTHFCLYIPRGVWKRFGIFIIIPTELLGAGWPLIASMDNLIIQTTDFKGSRTVFPQEKLYFIQANKLQVCVGMMNLRFY